MEKVWNDVNAVERKVVGVDFKTVSVANDGELFLSLGILATTSQVNSWMLSSVRLWSLT